MRNTSIGEGTHTCSYTFPYILLSYSSLSCAMECIAGNHNQFYTTHLSLFSVFKSPSHFQSDIILTVFKAYFIFAL